VLRASPTSQSGGAGTGTAGTRLKITRPKTRQVLLVGGVCAAIADNALVMAGNETQKPRARSYQSTRMRAAAPGLGEQMERAMADILPTPGGRLVIIVGSTAVFLGLAVLGWGGVSALFSHPALTALVLATFATSAAAFFAGGNMSAGVREDRSSRWVLAAFAAITFPFSWLPAWTDRNDLWTIDGDAVRWLGVVLYAAGGALRVYPVYVLGDRFSGLVAIQPGHTLVTTGIYGIIRHPSYLGLLINALGWALAFRSAAGVLFTAALVPMMLARIRSEEALLRAHFGVEYDAYCARTSRLIPGVF
jgi:protein-S-isoprenylcysteine O-methyltransferase Ste14